MLTGSHQFAATKGRNTPITPSVSTFNVTVMAYFPHHPPATYQNITPTPLALMK